MLDLSVWLFGCLLACDGVAGLWLQEFISSIDNLVTVKSDIMELKTLIQQLSQAVQDTGNDLLEKVTRTRTCIRIAYAVIALYCAMLCMRLSC